MRVISMLHLLWTGIFWSTLLVVAAPVLPFRFFLSVVPYGVSAQRVDRAPHGRRMEMKGIRAVVNNVKIYGGLATMDAIFRVAAQDIQFQAGISTLRRWYEHYESHGECPTDTHRYDVALQRRAQRSGSLIIPTTAWPQDSYDKLKELTMTNPEYYLDEYVDALYQKTGILYSKSSVHQVLTERFNWSLKVFTEIAIKRNDTLRYLYTSSLFAIVQDPRQLVFIDEVHKSRKECRRRRGWGPRGVDLELHEWFASSATYTVIAVCDIFGFITECCLPIPLGNDSNSPTGASGTVDSAKFEEWIRDYLIALAGLGEFDLGQPRSIVVLDNATIHHKLGRVLRRLLKERVYLLNTAPYSPDLNPIEKMFHNYKQYLRRNGRNCNDWYDLHMRAMAECVNCTQAIHFFRECGIPGANTMLTEEEVAAVGVIATMAYAAGNSQFH